MGRLPFVWIASFCAFTACCVILAAFASGSVGGSGIHPHRQDSVVFIPPVEIGRCTAGTLAAGRVVAVGRDRLALSSTSARGRLGSTVVTVNGERVARAETVRVAAGVVGTGSVVLVSSARRCASSVLVSVRVSSVVAYGRGSTSARVASVESKLRERVTAEKYVAGAYLFVTGLFGMWLLLHAGRLRRLEEQLARAREAARASTEASSSAPEVPSP